MLGGKAAEATMMILQQHQCGLQEKIFVPLMSSETSGLVFLRAKQRSEYEM